MGLNVVFGVEVIAGCKCLFKGVGGFGALFTFAFMMHLNAFRVRVFCTCDGSFQGSFQFSDPRFTGCDGVLGFSQLFLEPIDCPLS